MSKYKEKKKVDIITEYEEIIKESIHFCMEPSKAKPFDISLMAGESIDDKNGGDEE